jgi:hypothetical protein
MQLKGLELNAIGLIELNRGIHEGADGLSLYYPTLAGPIAACDIRWLILKTRLLVCAV